MSAQAQLDAPAVPAAAPRARRRRVHEARDFLAAWIPFTDAFAANAHAEARTRMEAFRRLESVDAATREALDNRVAALELRLARLRLRRRATLVLIGALSLLTFGVYAYVVVPGFVILHFEDSLKHGVVARYPGVLLGLFAAALAGTIAALAAAHRLLTRRFGARTTHRLEIAAGVAIASTWLTNGVVNAVSINHNPLLFVAMLYVCGTAVFAVDLAVTWLVIARANRLYRARSAAQWPDAVVAHELLAVLSRLEREGERWLDLDVRRDLLRRLENAARCVELYLPLRLRHDDPASEGWLRQEGRGIAAALRQMKRGLCLPDAATRETLLPGLAAALVHTVRGEWNLLERAEPPAQEEKPRLTRVQMALRTLAVAAPIAAVGVLLWWSEGHTRAALAKLAGDLAGSVSGLLLPLIAPLAAYTLLRAINPSALENLSAIRDFTQKK